MSVFGLECAGLGSGRLGLHRFPLVLHEFPEAEVCLIHIPTEKEQAEGASMSDIFYNFVNEPTYHFFEWVRSGGLGDVPRLIARAYDKAEQSPWLEMGEDVCTSVRDTLAGIIHSRSRCDPPSVVLSKMRLEWYAAAYEGAPPPFPHAA